MFQVVGRYKADTPVTNKWVDSSIKPDTSPQERAKLLEDDEYLANMRERENIYKFIIQTFVFDPNDILCYDKYPILLLGYDSTPLACELSQWKYPVTLIVQNSSEEKDARKIMARHNGVINIIRGGMTGSKIIVWIDDYKIKSKERKIEYIKYLSEHCSVLILSLPNLELRERISQEIKNTAIISKFGGTPLLIIYH